MIESPRAAAGRAAARGGRRGLSVGETRVGIPNLLEDLRDPYPGGLEQTILPAGSFRSGRCPCFLVPL